MADNKFLFKGILQHTHDTFSALTEEQRKGYLILVRDVENGKSVNTEIWFGNRRYAADAETLIKLLDATVSGASSHVSVSVVEEDGILKSISVSDDINQVVSDLENAIGVAQGAAVQEATDYTNSAITLLNATVTGDSSTNTALTQPIFVEVNEENGKLTSVNVKENIKAKYIDVLDANVTGNSKYVTVNVVETDGKVTSVNVSDTIDNAIANLNNASHTHSNKAELDKVKDGDVSKWDSAAKKVEDFFVLKDGESLNDAFDTLIEVQKYISDHGQVATGLLNDVTTLKKSLGEGFSEEVTVASELKRIEDECSGGYAQLDQRITDELGEYSNPGIEGEYDTTPATGLRGEIEERDAETLKSANSYTDSLIPIIGGPDIEE